MSENKYRVPSLDKALDVLEHVSQAIDPLSFSVLCKELGKSPSELFRVANGLVRRGYLLKDEKNHSLTLSLKLYELAHYHPRCKNYCRVLLAQWQNLAKPQACLPI